MGASVGREDLGAGFGSHGLDVNVVAVKVVDDEHVAVAFGGGLDETTGEVGEYLAGGGGEVGVDEVCAESRGRGGRRMEVVGAGVVGGGDWRDGSGVGRVLGVDGDGVKGGRIVGVFVGEAFGGLEVGALLVKVAFDHRDGWWWMASNLGGG